MRLNEREVSVDLPPLVIAEIGINHGGCLETAKEMVKLASQAGCECIKHQTHIVDDEMTDEARHIIPPNASISIWDIMEQSSLSLDEEFELMNFTRKLGMIYLSTPFSRAAADFLDEIQIPAFKIGSGEADNIPLIRHIASKGKPVIMSTGMQTIDTIRNSVQVLEDAKVDYALLECTNLYPSPPEIVSLNGITELRNSFKNAIVGFSDHSIGPYMALAAVANGACIIERHFTDSKYRLGPDISCSMDPAELRLLIDRSREIFIATKNRKERSEAEAAVYKFARSSIVADKDLIAGTVIKPTDIWARRPGTGEIPGYDFDLLIDRKLKRDVSFNQQLKLSDFEEQ